MEVILFKDLKKVAKKLERLKRRKEFLEDCKHFKIIPKFMRIKNKTLIKQYNREVKIFEWRLLRKIIRRQYAEIEKTKKLRDSMREKMRSMTDEENMRIYDKKLEFYGEGERVKCMARQNKKLAFWMRGRKGSIENKQINMESAYDNKSNFKLNAHQKSVLNMGPKFILQEKINLKDAVPHMEKALTYLPDTERNKIRRKLQEEIEKKMKMHNSDSEDIKVIMDLKRNRDIACIHTDKTGKMVILNKPEYIEMMENTFGKMDVAIVDKDPNKMIQNKIRNLMKDGKWPDDIKPLNLNHAPNTPRAFGRYKDHKVPPAMRPIVNKKEGPTYFLEKYMTKIYKQFLPSSDTSLYSTEEFIKKLREIEIGMNSKMVSFDIINLYPSIDTKEISKIVNDEIEKRYQDSKIKNTLISTSNLLINENYFQFHKKIYKQNGGVPMGSPISGILAELKLRRLEEIIREKFKNTIVHWLRYVDDVFAIVKNNYKIDDLLNDLNSIDKNIKFTVEIEKHNKLNYLDVTIFKTDNQKFETTVYRKPGSSREIINAKCKVPYSYKMASFRSYINRALTVCSNQELINEEIKIIENIAEMNGYNKRIVQDLYKKRIEILNNVQSGQKPKKKNTTAIPYCKGAANIIKKEAAKFNINVPIKPSPNIFQYIKSDRDPINPLETAGTYRIEYNDSKGEIGYYVGVTKRKIIERVKEHQRDIKLGRSSTALARLALKENIEIDFNNTKKLSHYNNKTYGYCRETIEIKNTGRICNDAEHFFLDPEWQHLISGRKHAQWKREGETEQMEGKS